MPVVNRFTSAEKATLLADPQAQALVTAQNWPGLATYLQAAGAGLPRTTISKGEMLRGLLPAVMRLPSKTDAEQKQWDRVLGIIQATETVTLSDAGVQAVIASGIAAGLLTQAEANVILLEPCTRIEQLLGRHMPAVSQEDLQAAFAPEPAPDQP